MITALISAVTGMVGGLLPDLMKEILETREHARQLEMMKATSELQREQMQLRSKYRMAELDAEMIVEEVKALGEQMKAIYETQKPIGVKWVDAWNATIRPATASAVMALFVAVAALYCGGVVWKMWHGEIDVFTAVDMVWASLVGEAIQGVLGFLFGYRSTRRSHA